MAMEMGPCCRLVLTIAAMAAPLSAAFAHEASADGSGLLHGLSGPEHLAGFALMGAMGGLYVHLFGGQLYIGMNLAIFTLMASHVHLPLTTQAGQVFAMGYLGFGLFAAFLSARLAMSLIGRLGVRPLRAGRD